MSERQEGWYWVKWNGRWWCAEFIPDHELSAFYWHMAMFEDHWDDKDFEEIGPRIPSPDEPWVTAPEVATVEMCREAAACGITVFSFKHAYDYAIKAAPKP